MFGNDSHYQILTQNLFSNEALSLSSSPSLYGDVERVRSQSAHVTLFIADGLDCAGVESEY